jgi:peptide-methionine (R)-S-oxide reductase
MFRTRKLSAGSITFNLNNFFIALTILVNLGACAHAQEVKHVTDSTKNSVELRNLSQDEWKKRLDPEVYQVTRCSATEMPFTGKYWNNHDKGTYLCKF